MCHLLSLTSDIIDICQMSVMTDDGHKSYYCTGSIKTIYWHWEYWRDEGGKTWNLWWDYASWVTYPSGRFMWIEALQIPSLTLLFMPSGESYILADYWGSGKKYNLALWNVKTTWWIGWRNALCSLLGDKETSGKGKPPDASSSAMPVRTMSDQTTTPAICRTLRTTTRQAVDTNKRTET